MAGAPSPPKGKSPGNHISQGFSPSVFIFLVPVFGHGLFVMAPLTKCLPVCFIPKQLFIPTVRNDMVHHCCFHKFFLFPAFLTQRMCFQEPASGSPPAAVIATSGSSSPVSHMQFCMFRTIIPCGQFRTTRMLAGLLRFSRHGVTTSSRRRNIYPQSPPAGIPAGCVTSHWLFPGNVSVLLSSYGIHRILPGIFPSSK